VGDSEGAAGVEAGRGIKTKYLCRADGIIDRRNSLAYNGFEYFRLRSFIPQTGVYIRVDIKAVLFDLDDTLYDRKLAQKKTTEFIIRQFPHVFNAFETDRIVEAYIESDLITSEEYDAGAPSEGQRKRRSRLFLELLGIKDDLTDAIAEIYVREYPTINTPKPGAVKLVNELSKRFPVGIVSNGLPDVQYRKLDTIGLRNVFSCIVLSEEIGIRKPDPRIFHRAAGLLNLQPSECLHVGDSYRSDVIGAKNSGMLSCWLKHEQSAATDESIKPDIVISSLIELSELI